mgnify:CR=1 FL=1
MKILLTDDHKIIRTVLGKFLRESLQAEITEASNGIEAFNLYDQNDFDLVIADINMPKMDGIELTKMICEKNPIAKVVALSMMDDSVSIKKMLKAGASAYVLKEGDTRELLSAVERVMSGEKYYPQAVSEVIMSSLSDGKRSKSEAKLTKRELEVLEQIFKEKSNQEIVDQLFISLRTVETHKHNIMEKTASKNLAGLVKYAISHKLFDHMFY